MSTIGERIKSFRKMKNISQMDLENSINASPGSLSRIESGKVDPTRQTVQKIADALKLNIMQLSYLDGKLSQPASIDEIESVKLQLSEYLKKDTIIAYISDDRFRLIEASKGMKNLFQLSDSKAQSLYGKSIISIMLDRELGIRQFLDNRDYIDLIKFQLFIFKADAGFMEHDEYFAQAIRSIHADKEASNIYRNIEVSANFSNQQSRTVTFNIDGTYIKLKYSIQPIQNHPRFVLVEYSS